MSESLVLPFEPEAPGSEAFTVDLDGFEGPLDLLLVLARQQKVDLATISILKLAEQYLLFVEEARKRRLELAADYLVMAAWLAYLKSRLLLPRPGKGDEPPVEDMAEQLARRLQRLATIRDASARLMERPRLGVDVFARGAPEPTILARRLGYEASLYDLLAAYGAQRMLKARAVVRLEKRNVWSLAEARAALERLIGESFDWTPLDAYLVAWCTDPKERKTAIASSFASSLEMAREGLIDLSQDKAFAPLFLRKTRKGEGA